MKRRLVALIGLVGLLIAGTVPLPAADEPYDFYAILSMTGPAAFLGQNEAPTMQAVEKYWNARGGIQGHPLHVIVQDDQSNAATGVQLVNGVIAKHVAAFIGPTFGAPCAAVLPLVQNDGPVMYCLSTNINPPANSYAFVFMVKNRDQTGNGLRYLHAKGVRTLAILASSDTTGQENVNGVVDSLKDPDLHDMKVVDDERFGITDLSIAAQVVHVKASGAQAVLALTTGTPFGTVLRGLSEGGYDGWVLTGAGNAIVAQVKQYAAYLPKNLIFTTLPTAMEQGASPPVQATRKAFAAAMKDVGINEPTLVNTVPWDPMTMMVEGLRKFGPGATPTQMRDYLMSIHDFVGINGTYDFRRGDQRGLDPKSTGVIRYDTATGAFVQVSKPGGAPL